MDLLSAACYIRSLGVFVQGGVEVHRVPNRPILETLEPRRLLAEILSFGFEEASGNALDAATADGAQNGTLANGAVRVSPGLIGNNALSLDGTDDKVTIGAIASTANVSGISLAAWID